MKCSKLPVLAIVTLILALGVGRVYATTYTYTTLEDPAAPSERILPNGISGDTIVGYFTAGSPAVHGFSETGGVYTTLDVPGAANTFPIAISGSTVIGNFENVPGGTQYPFSEMGGVYTILGDPAAAPGTTVVRGISGSTIVGYFTDASLGTHGFSETGGVYTPLDDDPAGVPGKTFVRGISGSTIVGYFTDVMGRNHGFSETGGVFTTLDDPAAGPLDTFPSGISGSTIVGNFSPTSPVGGPGFSETGGVYTTLNDPAALPGPATLANGIDGDTIVGYYQDITGFHGFVATAVPEPAGPGVLALSAAGV